MPRWSVTAAASVLRDLLIPAGGLYGILFDRPLTPLVAGAYLVMMGLPIAGFLDSRRERHDGKAEERSTP
jgi:hypothetical protein